MVKAVAMEVALDTHMQSPPHSVQGNACSVPPAAHGGKRVWAGEEQQQTLQGMKDTQTMAKITSVITTVIKVVVVESSESYHKDGRRCRQRKKRREQHPTERMSIATVMLRSPIRAVCLAHGFGSACITSTMPSPARRTSVKRPLPNRSSACPTDSTVRVSSSTSASAFDRDSARNASAGMPTS